MIEQTNDSFDPNAFSKITKIVSEILGIPSSEIESDHRFVEDLGADSLAMYELRSAVEDKFKLLIPDNDVVHLSTIRSIATYIAQKQIS
jgi:acyl carrier protein